MLIIVSYDSLNTGISNCNYYTLEISTKSRKTNLEMLHFCQKSIQVKKMFLNIKIIKNRAKRKKFNLISKP